MPAAEARPVDSVLPTVARLRYDAALMRRIDELHLRYPFAGARMLRGCAGRRGSLYDLLQSAQAASHAGRTPDRVHCGNQPACPTAA